MNEPLVARGQAYLDKQIYNPGIDHEGYGLLREALQALKEAEISAQIKHALTRGIIGLRNPPYHEPGMNTSARLLHACLCAYRKHVSMNENLGWDELGTILHNAICEAIGDPAFLEWNEAEWDGEAIERDLER